MDARFSAVSAVARQVPTLSRILFSTSERDQSLGTSAGSGGGLELPQPSFRVTRRFDHFPDIRKMIVPLPRKSPPKGTGRDTKRT